MIGNLVRVYEENIAINKFAPHSKNKNDFTKKSVSPMTLRKNKNDKISLGMKHRSSYAEGHRTINRF